MRFTLRDLFWLTLLVAVVCVNWITYRAAMEYKADADAANKRWLDSQADESQTTVYQSSTTITP